MDAGFTAQQRQELRSLIVEGVADALDTAGLEETILESARETQDIVLQVAEKLCPVCSRAHEVK